MNRILVGLDSSDRAEHVLSQAVAIAKARGARLCVLRAVGLPIGIPNDALSVAPEALPEILCAHERAALAKLMAGVSAELVEHADARIGTPWQTICDYAGECDADLVVIGTHGHSAIDRLLGTTAARVVNHAPCSVLVVR